MPDTIRDLVLAHASSDRPGLAFEDRTWTWREYVDAAAARAHVLADRHAAGPHSGQALHVGVLMENTPEMAFALGAGAIGGHVTVGVNATRRGEALAADVRRADCTVLLTDLGRITRIPSLADAIWATFHEPVRKLLHAGEADGSLRGVDDEMTASAIFGAVTMVGLHYVVTGQPVDPDATAARIDDLLLHGLAPTPNRSSKGRTR